ncbi:MULTISPECIES: serine/threonine-protein kinase [Streptomyces]|uniref:non-specific serine/threonine protein kinase n=2 Tax=Streptomyces scabiei TaxID=1930 RepID=C9YW98_STRSW|nr:MULTISPECIES: serine/threonine-protein kinase [Streptomyces]MBP5861802.1 serine/threonine protein kinase [Streptomyces sp. LBUM 1484]MBP5869266.1 serine/threonine protein kinase [Streptomyces sp. LBUM 1485]MBP5907714.1 serine/threonine protein kinase [Streptomyces sp. LBUM 1478]MBP5929359.1 serine/threonine protein kinase [Streptomyces sp. LBUM 1479]MBP5877744.1 serine/threonine protein kinase [Streptomyces sp. LBUM 1477]
MSSEHASAEGALLSDRYRLERLLGAGGQGQVYAGVDEQLGRRVAVKVLQPLAELSGDLRQEALARFDREVRALARLAHDHIVTIFDRGTHQGTPFSVMEFLDGPSLAQKLRESGPLPVAQAVDICARTAGALSAAHHLRIWHRDVKPANILLTGTGRPKLCDFGLVSALTPAAPLLTRRGTTPGCTPGYASPEQARGATAAGPSDVFSLGVTLYALLAGGTPFGDANGDVALLKVLNEEPPRLPVPADLAALITAMLDKDPKARPTAFSSAVRLRTILDRLEAAGRPRLAYTPTQRGGGPKETVEQPVVHDPAPSPGAAVDLAAEREIETGAAPPPPDDDLWQALEDAEHHLTTGRFHTADTAFAGIAQCLQAADRHTHPALTAARLGRVRALDGLGRHEDAEATLNRLRDQAARDLPPHHRLRRVIERLRLTD